MSIQRGANNSLLTNLTQTYLSIPSRPWQAWWSSWTYNNPLGRARYRPKKLRWKASQELWSISNNYYVCCYYFNYRMWKWEVPIKRSAIDPSVEKMGFWEWSQSLQYVVKRLIPQNTGTYPRTAFYELWD